MKKNVHTAGKSRKQKKIRIFTDCRYQIIDSLFYLKMYID